MKCNKCGNPNSKLSMTLIIDNKQTGRKIVVEGCGFCIPAEMLAAHMFAKKMHASDAVIVEKMAEKLFTKSYEAFKNSMDAKH